MEFIALNTFSKYIIGIVKLSNLRQLQMSANGNGLV